MEEYILSMKPLQHAGTQVLVTTYFTEEDKNIANNLVDLLAAAEQEITPAIGHDQLIDILKPTFGSRSALGVVCHRAGPSKGVRDQPTSDRFL